jgi:tripartite-type tricarboxylate transporter receptor subunit TctC
VAGFESSTDMALMAPANLPEPIATRLSQAVRAAVTDAAFRQQIIAQGADPVGSSPAEFAAYWTAESAKWGDLIRARNIRMPS